MVLFYSPGAIGTAGSSLSVLDGILPLMAAAANPPNNMARFRSNILWRQRAVPCWMPFRGHLWLKQSSSILCIFPEL
jgi:hypothetical protein